MLLEYLSGYVSVLSCSIMFMGNRAFSTQACQNSRLTKHLWMCYLWTIMIGCLPVATKLLLHKQFQGSCVAGRRNAKLTLLTTTAVIPSYHHWHIVKEKLIWVMFFLCHTLLCPVCHHLKTAKAVWKMTFPRGVKKSAALPISFSYMKSTAHLLDIVKVLNLSPLFFSWQASFESVPFSYVSLGHHDGCKENSTD